MAVTSTSVDSRSSPASSASSTPTSSLKHPLPARPPSSPPPAPTFNLMTPTPPPSMTRPQPDSSSDSKLSRNWRANPLVSQLTNLDRPTPEQSSPVQPPAPAANSPNTASAAFNNTTPNPLQTTNVYINGLPPHFRDEELFELASRFGTVLSCRTFTRQLSDTPSGYGFVLFQSIESAQECINVLRSHHNLHPHFAKQAHKIPGIPSSTPAEPSVGHVGDIYIEGLPMHVDASTLCALLAPHVVTSSRFFADTRVQPPLLIAFVRLASRTAAQDVYRRLHGRTIRGYSARLVVSLVDFEGRKDGLVDIDMDGERGGVSGIPIPQAETYDPSSNTNFSLVSQNHNQNQTQPLACNNTNNLTQHYSAHQVHQALHQSQGQNQYQRPVDELLHTLHDLNINIPPVPPLQPLSTTLHELQAQLENLRPLLAAYGTPITPVVTQNQNQNLMQNFSMQTFHPQSAPHLSVRHLGGQTQQRLRSLSQPHEHEQPLSIGGPSRAHTTGAHALGLGAPPRAQSATQRHVSNPEKAPGSELTWTRG